MLHAMDEDEVRNIREEYGPTFELLSLAPLETVIEVQGQDQMMFLRVQIQLEKKSRTDSERQFCLSISATLNREATASPQHFEKVFSGSCSNQVRGGRLWTPLLLNPYFSDHGAGLGALIELPDENGSGLVEIVFDERARQTQTHRVSWRAIKGSTE